MSWNWEREGAMADMKWISEINEDLNKMEDVNTEELWKKWSIYKLPRSITDLNKRAYTPQIVSFGPYHFDHSNSMEKHKRRALLHFLKRCGKPVEMFVEALAKVVEDLKDSYNPLDPKWEDNTARFLQLMLLDGCFMLEVMRTGLTLDDYPASDPIFSNHGKMNVMPFIKRDMLMLENQLPMLLLVKLEEIETDYAKDEESVNRLIVKFYCSSTVPFNMGKCVHVLDVYRKSLLHEEPMHKTSFRRTWYENHGGGNEIIWSATELRDAGIRLKKSDSASLRDISFSGGILRLPIMVVDDSTESMLLNMIAFERFHVGAGNEVTAYVFFMGSIIDNEKDVGLLQSRGIVQNFLASDTSVAKLINSLSTDIIVDPESSLDQVHKSVYHYCKKPWNEWRANLIHTYFRNPWAIISLLAGVLLLALTVAQASIDLQEFLSPEDQEPSANASSSTSPSKILVFLISIVWMMLTY